ncbi:hypothetical protein [Methylomonas sp. 2B]
MKPNSRRSIGWFEPSATGLRIAVCLLLCVLLVACGSRPLPPSQVEQAEKLEKVLLDGGYRPARRFEIETGREVWHHDGRDLDVSITVPTAPGRYPLIVYLPALGEDAGGGRLWREFWAKAGYAVFCMQPVAIGQALRELNRPRGGPRPGTANDMGPPDDEDGEAAGMFGGWFGGGPDPEDGTQPDDEDDSDRPEDKRRPSKAARSSELRYLGHEYFAAEHLPGRVADLAWAYQQLRTRAGLGQRLYAAADVDKLVLAGYDLGAQTVSAVLGENFGVELPGRQELRPVAGILLSPSVDLATGNVRSRFQPISSPLLAVTGSEDDDSYAIGAAGARLSVWEHARPGGKYLLVLTEASHQLLAGAGIGFGRGQRGGSGGGPEMGMGGGGPGGRLLLNPVNRVGGGGGGMGGGGGPPMGGGPGYGLRGEDLEKMRIERAYKQVAAVQSASTAFLDLLVKNDEFAKAWLLEKFNPWLGKAGVFKGR